MSFLEAQGIWSGIIAVAVVLVTGALLVVFLFVRRQAWESRRFSKEIMLLHGHAMELAQSVKDESRADLEGNAWYRFLLDRGLSEVEALGSIIQPASVKEAATALEQTNSEEGSKMADVLLNHQAAQRDFNAARVALGRPRFRFKKREQST